MQQHNNTVECTIHDVEALKSWIGMQTLGVSIWYPWSLLSSSSNNADSLSGYKTDTEW
jgi:hypothetical protein